MTHTEDDSDDSTAKMSFLEHLDELRKRIIYSALSIGVGFLIAFIFVQQLFDFVMRPLQAGLPPGAKLVYTEPTEAFVLYIQIAAIAGLVIALPLVMAQVWLFIAPGLYAHEKKMALPFILMSSGFFIAGAAFSHYVVFPLTWKFFVSFTSDYLTFMPRIEPAFSLYIKMLLAFGLVLGVYAVGGTGLLNLLWPPYGQRALETFSSVYPGYHATRSFGEVLVAACYGVLDGGAAHADPAPLVVQGDHADVRVEIPRAVPRGVLVHRVVPDAVLVRTQRLQPRRGGGAEARGAVPAHGLRVPRRGADHRRIDADPASAAGTDLAPHATG